MLFLDVVGSTALAQHLDPEDIHAVMDGALARCTAVVEAQRASVLQYAGDSLLAVFGADERARTTPSAPCAAGLALLGPARALAPEVQAAHGHAGFDVRVGIHTGGVLLGGGVDAEGTHPRQRGQHRRAHGADARRPAACASATTPMRHVRGVFDVEPQPPM